MTRLWRPILAVLAAAALSACAYSEGVYIYNVCLEDFSEHAKGVDWSEARIVEVDIVGGGEFSPSYVKFKQNEPQILRITNTENRLRLFRAPKFFRSIAIGKVTVGDREYTERCLAAINVPPGAVAEIHMVPIDQGKYDFDDDPTLVSILYPFEQNFGFAVIN
ncbi:MAG: hypothetical protein QGI06_04835 [Rhodospirillales bacterium]|nr:hypothetical protein [Rhodospirillales bacterium]